MELFRAERIPTSFTGVRAADALLNDLKRFPHALVLTYVADRQVKAEVAWRIPHELSQRLGGFAFNFLRAVPRERFREVFSDPSPLHRFPGTMSENVYAAVQRIAGRYCGNAANMWIGTPPSAEVVLRFLGFRRVGPKIATMATNILARDFKVPFSDYYSVDVSVDVHLRRVFTRLGLIPEDASVEQVVYRARALNPAFPGLMDLPAWEIGRKWCKPGNPNCAACYMLEGCPTGQRMVGDGPATR
jgi:endonuclease III